jgi:Putative Flp pilus-assembly TadE/G-like
MSDQSRGTSACSTSGPHPNEDAIDLVAIDLGAIDLGPTQIGTNARAENARVEKEGGAVAIFAALILTVLLGFVGLGVDIGFWYYQGWHQQQAADQASLAGAVFLPEDGNQAIAVARQSAAANGYAADVQIVPGAGSKSNQLTVSLSRNYKGLFSQVLGKRFQNIYRTSLAEYIPPLTIGSPFARAGNDPENAAGGNFNYWLNQHGPWVPKHQGDRYASDICDADPTVTHPTPYACIPSTQTRGKNLDYDRIGKFGYRYSVDVNTVDPGKDLVIEVFDGVTTNVGNGCTAGNLLPSPSERQALSRWVSDADVRYRPGNEPNGKNWCVADQINASFDPSRNTQYMDTEFSVHAPSRSVAAGAMVQNTVPPTTAAPQITTTTLAGGGGTVAGPCSPSTTTGATTFSVINDRATPLKAYLVNPACVETLVFTDPPTQSWTLNSFAGYRYRFYDGTSGAFVSEYTVPTPASSSGGYARRSLEPVSMPNKFVTFGSGNATVVDPAAIAAPLAASFEIIPAANNQAGCVTFKSAEAVPRYMSFTGLSVTMVTSVAGSAAAAATWCPTGGGARSSTRFTSAASGLFPQYLSVDAFGTVSTSSLIPLLPNANLDWFINMPMAPRPNEPLPMGTNLMMEYKYNNLCAIANPAADSPVLLQACLTSLDHQFELQPGTGSNVKILHSQSLNYIRPDNSATAANTPAQIEPLRNDASDEWVPTVLPGGLVSFQSAVNQGYLFDSSACSATAPVTLRVSPAPPSACQQLYLQILRTPLVAPVPYVGSTASVSLVAHLNNPGPCGGAGGATTLSVTNQRPVDVGVYSLDANCRESYLGDLAAGASQTFSGLAVGQTIRFYDTQPNQLARNYVIASANPSFTLTTTGSAQTCSPAPGAAATINFVNQRPEPIRVFSVDTLCNESPQQTIASGWPTNTTAGTIWKVVDTYSGAVLRTFSAVAGAQTITEVPSVLTSGNCSAASGSSSTLDIVNKRSTPLIIKTVGADCIETTYGTAGPNATTSIISFTDQRWKVYDGATQAGDITLANPVETLTIDDPFIWTWDPNAGAVTNSGTVLLCSRIETAYPLVAYSSADRNTGTVSQLINPVDGVHDDGAGTRDPIAENFATGFRRWRQICKIPAASVAVGRYTITVKTNLNDESAGSNSFSLRAQWRGGTPADTSETGLQLSAMENFPVFINLGTTSSTLYMTRLNAAHAGRTMRLELFDIGDVNGGTMNFQIKPPTNSNLGTSWPCSMKLVSADGTFAPTGFTASNCSIVGLSRFVYNGAAVQVDIPVPDNFTCDTTIPTNCWTTVTLTYNNGATPTDRTTWSASVLGDPLRIVE